MFLTEREIEPSHSQWDVRVSPFTSVEKLFRIGKVSSNQPFAAYYWKVRNEPFPTAMSELQPDFANVAICALLPFVVIASNGRFQPF